MARYNITGGDNRVYGPADENELRRWIAEGRLNSQSLVQLEGSTEWRPLSSFPEFAEALGVRAGVPPVGAPPIGAPPPSPAPGVPVNAELLAVEILAGQPTVNVGQCLSRAWNLLFANFGVIFGATAIVWLIGAVCERLPGVGLGYWLIRGPLYGGLYLIFLHRIRNQPAAVGDVFAGFRLAFVQLMLAGLVSSLLAGIGFCFCILPWIYLTVAWVFSIPLVADKNLEFWSAMELSRKVVTRVWFPVFGLLVLVFLPTILVSLFALGKIGATSFSTWQDIMGAGGPPDPARLNHIIAQAVKSTFPVWALTKIVLLLNLPVALGALMYAYEDLFGPRQTPSA
jgi:hypothetical protein